MDEKKRFQDVIWKSSLNPIYKKVNKKSLPKHLRSLSERHQKDLISLTRWDALTKINSHFYHVQYLQEGKETTWRQFKILMKLLKSHQIRCLRDLFSQIKNKYWTQCQNHIKKLRFKLIRIGMIQIFTHRSSKDFNFAMDYKGIMVFHPWDNWSQSKTKLLCNHRFLLG